MQQKIIDRDFWPYKFSKKAIGSTFIFFFAINALFSAYYTPLPLMFLILGTVVFFFRLLNFYTKKWQNISTPSLYKNLFFLSLAYRFIFLGLLYLFTWIYNPNAFPMSMFSADAWVYRSAGTAVVGNIFNLKFLNILPNFFRGEDNWGFPVYIGFIYTYLFESVAFILILNIFLGSFTVVLMAKIANILYSKRHAVFTGVIAMLMPALMWYGAMYLKETVMIFLTILVVYYAIKMVKLRKFNVLSTVIILLSVPALFYFRAAISVLLFLSLMNYFFLNFIFKDRSRALGLVSLIIFAIGIVYISFNLGQHEKIYDYYDGLHLEAEQRVGGKTRMAGNVSIKTGLAVPFVAANAFFAPYPSFLNMDVRQIGVISHAHIEVVRVLIYYFGLIGLLILVQKDLVNSSLIISFGAGYILILAITGGAMFSRYHLPAVPFIILFISVGFLNSSKKWFSYYDKYLIGIWAVVLMWHIFKMIIRGII